MPGQICFSAYDFSIAKAPVTACIFVMSLLILATNILARVILGGIAARCTKKQ